MKYLVIDTSLFRIGSDGLPIGETDGSGKSIQGIKKTLKEKDEGICSAEVRRSRSQDC